MTKLYPQPGGLDSEIEIIEAGKKFAPVWRRWGAMYHNLNSHVWSAPVKEAYRRFLLLEGAKKNGLA